MSELRKEFFLDRELRREVVSEFKDKIIKDVINDLDVFSSVYDLDEEQSKDMYIITKKLCLLVGELENIVTEAYAEAYAIVERRIDC